MLGRRQKVARRADALARGGQREIAAPHLEIDLLAQASCILAGDVGLEVGLAEIVLGTKSGEERKTHRHADRVRTRGRIRDAVEGGATGVRRKTERGQAFRAHFADASHRPLHQGARGGEVGPPRLCLRDQLIDRGRHGLHWNVSRQHADVEGSRDRNSHRGGQRPFEDAQILLERLVGELRLRQRGACLKDIGDRGDAGVVTRVRRIEAGLQTLQRRALRIQKCFGVEMSIESLLRLQHDVLNLLIVVEVGGDERLPRFLDDPLATAEIKEKVGQCQRGAEGGGVEDIQPSLHRLPRAVVRRVEVELRVVRGASRAECGLGGAGLEPGGARGGIVGQRNVDGTSQREGTRCDDVVFRKGGWDGRCGGGPWRGRRRGCAGIACAGARGQKQDQCDGERPHRFLFSSPVRNTSAIRLASSSTGAGFSVRRR